MRTTKLIPGLLLIPALLLAVIPAKAAGKPVRPPPTGYKHEKFAPESDILKVFHGFAVSFDSEDDDDGKPGADLLRLPHWVAQELRRWEPPAADQADDKAWCLDTLKSRPTWFTDADLFASVKVDRYQTVRVDRNRYSVPRACVGRWVWAHVSCWKVSVYAENRQMAEHDRLFSNSQWQLDPLHYLDLIAQRPGSFESARPILQWRAHWPEDYELLLKQLRSRRGHNRGTREFVEILKLHENYRREEIQEAVSQALEQHCPAYEAVRHLVGLRQSSSVVTEPLPAELIPGITDRQVSQSEVANFNRLLGGTS